MQRAHRRSVSIVISANQRAYSRVARPSVDERCSEPGGRLRSSVRCRGRRARPMCVASRSPRPQPRPLLRSPPRPPSPRHRDNTPVGHPTQVQVSQSQSVPMGVHQSQSGLFTGSLSSQPVSVSAKRRQSGLIRGNHLTLLFNQGSSEAIMAHQRQSSHLAFHRLIVFALGR
jgi:hypothetical protein